MSKDKNSDGSKKVYCFGLSAAINKAVSLQEVYADNSQKQESHSGTSGERLVSTHGTVLPS